MFAPVVFNVRATIVNEVLRPGRADGPRGDLHSIEAVGDEELCGEHAGRANDSLAYANRKLSLGLRGRIFGAVRRFKVELQSPGTSSREESPVPGLSGAPSTGRPTGRWCGSSA
jgi:hypothetical protein